MATPSFAPILDRAPTEIEKPKPITVGSYVTIIQGQARYDKSQKKQTEFVEFTHKFISAGEDVDADALKDSLSAPDGSVRNLADITMKNTFYLTENSVWRLKEFLTHCGFDTDDDSVTLRQMIEDCPGKTVGVYIGHEASQDGTSIFARINKTFAVE